MHQSSRRKREILDAANDDGKNSKTFTSHWVMGGGTCLPGHLSNKQAFSIFLMFMFAVLGFALYNSSDPPGFEKQHDHAFTILLITRL